DSENDNEKVNVPSFPSPEPKVSCFDDLDFFKDFENEFPTIVYNDALTSKSDHITEPTLSPQHIDEFDLKDETSLSKYDAVEQNVLYFNDLFTFNIMYPDDLKSGKDNNDNEIDIIQSSGINKFLEASHDKINKFFNVESFIVELKVNIVTWNYLVNGMLLNLIKNLYVPFGIPFDPKRYYKDGVCIRMSRRPSASRRLKRYFQAHAIVVITDQPIKQLLSNSEISGRMLKWKFKLEGYDIQYRPMASIKRQILVDFIMERPEEDSLDEPTTEPGEIPEP
ncbi:hypothetical protein Tco_1303074, partial [Tanacetum coccineum]